MKNFLCIITAILFCASSYAQVINVPADQPTIQAGINAASDGDTVLVADGIYFENIKFKSKEIVVASHFLIDLDETHIENTIIDGSNPSNPDSAAVVMFTNFEDTTSVLYGFTIQGGLGIKSFEEGLVFGGETNPGSTANTESWNGTSWTEINNLSTANYSASYAGSGIAALYAGGSPGNKTTSEEFTAPAAVSTVTTS